VAGRTCWARTAGSGRSQATDRQRGKAQDSIAPPLGERECVRSVDSIIGSVQQWSRAVRYEMGSSTHQVIPGATTSFTVGGWGLCAMPVHQAS
jgi:hypothetical protein